MSGTLGKKNHFKVQYKILKSFRANKIQAVTSPYLVFIALDFSSHISLLSIENY